MNPTPANVLKNWLHVTRTSPAKLSKRTGLSVRTIYNLLAGKAVSWRTAKLLSKATALPVEKFDAS
jgi:hypothetical protein